MRFHRRCSPGRGSIEPHRHTHASARPSHRGDAARTRHEGVGKRCLRSRRRPHVASSAFTERGKIVSGHSRGDDSGGAPRRAELPLPAARADLTRTPASPSPRRFHAHVERGSHAKRQRRRSHPRTRSVPLANAVRALGNCWLGPGLPIAHSITPKHHSDR
jgi:hypothetical protein